MQSEGKAAVDIGQHVFVVEDRNSRGVGRVVLCHVFRASRLVTLLARISHKVS